MTAPDTPLPFEVLHHFIDPHGQDGAELRVAQCMAEYVAHLAKREAFDPEACKLDKYAFTASNGVSLVVSWCGKPAEWELTSQLCEDGQRVGRVLLDESARLLGVVRNFLNECQVIEDDGVEMLLAWDRFPVVPAGDPVPLYVLTAMNGQAHIDFAPVEE